MLKIFLETAEKHLAQPKTSRKTKNGEKKFFVSKNVSVKLHSPLCLQNFWFQERIEGEGFDKSNLEKCLIVPKKRRS